MIGNNLVNLITKLFYMRNIVRIYGLIWWLTVLLSLNLHAQNNFEVRSVTFDGNKTLEEDFLLDQLALKEVSYLEKLITKKQPFLYNQRLVDLDLERLLAIYHTEGFLKAKVSLAPLQINKDKQIVKLQIHIDEGEPVLVDKVGIIAIEEVQGINLDSLFRKLGSELELKQGSRFRDEAIKQDILLIANAFRNLGYAYVDVNYDLELSRDTLKTNIIYRVKSGPVCYFGETTILGNKHVTIKYLRKQLEHEKGEIYNQSLLNKIRERLYQLQLFRIVSVVPIKEHNISKSSIPVSLYIEEAPRLSSRIGFGYGTEDRFRTFLDLNYRGFMGGSRRINLFLKHSSLVPYHVSLKWIQPQFFSPKSSITVNPFIIRNSEPGYEIRTYGINIPVTYRFNSWFSSTLTYYLENVEQQIEAVDSEHLDLESEKFLYDKSGILLSAVFDNSTPKFTPRKGFNFSFGLKVNGYMFGSNFNYTRFWGDIRHYQKIGSWVLASRLMGGGINSNDSSDFIPVEDRFYSGGSNSIRGWSRSELGPKRESGTPMGGKSILEANLELRYPLFWRVSGVAFIDSGNVWESSYNYQLDNLVYAIGGGLRIDTPIGPIRFDLGFPVWNQKKSPQLFISVGQAF